MHLRNYFPEVKVLIRLRKRKTIKAFLMSAKVDLVCPKATKVQKFSIILVRSLKSVCGMDSNALGFERHLDFLGHWMGRGRFSLSCKFRTVEDSSICVFTRVYGPP